MRLKALIRSLAWITLFLALACLDAGAMEDELPYDQLYLPREMKQLILQFLESPQYSSIARVDRDWNSFLNESHEYQIHRLLHELIHSEFATQGSVYQQLEVIEHLMDLFENVGRRMVAAGRSDALPRSVLLRLENRALAVAKTFYRGPFMLLSPLAKLAQNPRLSKQGQETVYRIANRSNLVYRDRLWLSLVVNPNLSSNLLDRLELRNSVERLPPNWGGYFYEIINERLSKHPQMSWEKQNRRYEELGQLKFYPQRVGRVIEWAQQVNLSPEIQRQVFESVIPQLLALPREAHLPYLGRLARALAKNSSLIEEKRSILAQLAFQDEVVARDRQEELLSEFALTSVSESLQKRIWDETVRRRCRPLDYRVLSSFALNPQISGELQKKFNEVLPQLSGQERQSLRIKMAQNFRLGDQVVAWLVSESTPEKVTKLRSDDSVIEMVEALVKNSGISKKSVDSLVEWIPGVADPEVRFDLIKSLMNQANLSEKMLERLETYGVELAENPFSPEWLRLRKALYKILPRFTNR